MLKIRSKLTREILLYFFLNPEAEHHVNELARQLSLDPKNSHTKLCELEKDGILKSRRRGNQRCFTLAHDYPFFNEYRKIILGTIGIEHEVRSLLRTVDGIEQAHIFGSYAEDAMDAESDIDILVIGDQDPRMVSKAILPLQKKTGRNIQLVNISMEEFGTGARSDFLNSILAGKTIRLL